MVSWSSFAENTQWLVILVLSPSSMRVPPGAEKRKVITVRTILKWEKSTYRIDQFLHIEKKIKSRCAYVGIDMLLRIYVSNIMQIGCTVLRSHHSVRDCWFYILACTRSCHRESSSSQNIFLTWKLNNNIYSVNLVNYSQFSSWYFLHQGMVRFSGMIIFCWTLVPQHWDWSDLALTDFVGLYWSRY